MKAMLGQRAQLLRDLLAELAARWWPSRRLLEIGLVAPRRGCFATPFPCDFSAGAFESGVGRILKVSRLKTEAFARQCAHQKYQEIKTLVRRTPAERRVGFVLDVLGAFCSTQGASTE